MKESLVEIVVPTNRYPIQIISWRAKKGDSVGKDEALGIYEYIEIEGEESVTKRAEIRIPYAGTIDWLAELNYIAQSQADSIGAIREDCSHSVQLHGLCALCGQDLSIGDYTGSDTHRVNINLTHDSKGVMISHQEAARIEKQTTERLLKQKKLSLLLDLDQTVVHATDENVNEWTEYQENPDTRKEEIYRFTLQDSPRVYFLKLRPNTHRFLAALSKKYEMHIYTMGTRAYAQAVANILDPDKSYFKDRILSRDESGNNFFVGIGDINEPLKEGEEQHEHPQTKTVINSSQLARLQDYDNELTYVLEALNTLHLAFYSKIDEKEYGEANVTKLLPAIKERVLKRCRIVFSGVIPLGRDPALHDFWINAVKFGAECMYDIDETTTHLIANKIGTVKVNAAVDAKIWIVKPEWLFDSISQWEALPEKDYILNESFLFPKKEVALVNTDWTDMDKEVEEAFLETGSESEESEEIDQPLSKPEDFENPDDDLDWLSLEIEKEITEHTTLGKRKEPS